MTAEELLRELEPLTHDARMRRMVELGRRASDDADVAATLAALERGGWYERRLALQACYGSRDGAQVMRALTDPSRSIRALAVALVPLVCDDAQVSEAFQRVSRDRQIVLVRRLRRRRRLAPIDAFVADCAARNDDLLPEILPYASSAVVELHLDRVLPSMGLVEWGRLVHLHPAIAGSSLRGLAAAAERHNQRLIWIAGEVVPHLAESRPDQALEIVETLRRHMPLGALDLQRLADRRPAAVADLLLATGDQVRVNFDRVAHRLDTPRLLALLERHGDTLRHRATWFRRLSSDARLEIYRVVERGWRDSNGALDDAIVALLPRAEREAEARRHLALPSLSARPDLRLPYATLLPWDDARTTLDPFVRDPDPNLRALALRRLIFAARYHRDRLAELLTLLHARRNEQDPVRQAMLTALAELPPGRWREEHLDDLGGVIQDALDAADLSPGTATAAEILVVALAPFHLAWSVRWLATLAREHGRVSSFRLDDRLSDADVRRLAPALLPVLQSWQTRERESHLIGVAQSLSRRLRAFDELVDLLERVLDETRDVRRADAILSLLAQWRRDRLATLVPALLERDPSWIIRPVVYTYLHRRRQDLLTPFLGRQPHRGRFSSGKTYFVLPVTSGFERWTPTQQATFAETLRVLIQDHARDIPTLQRAIGQLAAMPSVPPRRLIQLADARSTRIAIRDAALWALGRLDAADGVPTLLEALNDDRARVAIYALRKSVLTMPPERALSLLREVPLERVTVAKEVVRLAGDLQSEEAYQWLLMLYQKDLHRDVRVALLRALWNWTERDETWPILEQAARSTDPALAAGVVRVPGERQSPAAQDRLISLLVLLLSHPEPRIRLETLQRCRNLPVTDREARLLSPLLEALGSPIRDECAAAAGAVFATYVGRDAVRVGGAIRRILSNRYALRTVVNQLLATIRWDRDQLLPTAVETLAALRPDPLTAGIRADLAILFLPPDELVATLRDLAASDELHPEALMSAVKTLEGRPGRTTVDLLALEMALASDADPRLRRLALAALVAAARDPSGWTDDRLGRLRTYRADLSSIVAAAAQFTFPPGESVDY